MPSRYRPGMTERFPLRRCWATKFLWPLVRGEVAAEVGDGHVTVKLGGLGRAEIPLMNVARLSRMNWPWWGGIGVRLGRKLVAFTTSWGEVAVIELIEPIQVKAPLKWTTPRVVVSTQDVTGFLDAIARRRTGEPEVPTSSASR